MTAEGNGGGGGFDGPSGGPIDIPQNKPEILKEELTEINFFDTDSEETGKVGEQLSEVVKNVFGYESFDRLNELASKKGDTEEIRKAKEARSMFIDGVDVVLREKRESRQISDDDLHLGPRHLADKLHSTIAWVAEDISSRYIDKSLNPLLDRLESASGNRAKNLGDSAYAELLVQRIDMAIPKILSVDTDDSDAVVVALNHKRANLRAELGDYEPNTSVASVGMVEQKKATTRKTETSAGERKRAPGPTAKLNETMTDVGGKVEELTGAIGEQTKATNSNTEQLKKIEYITKRLTTQISAKGGLFSPDRDNGQYNRTRTRNGLEFKYPGEFPSDLPKDVKTEGMTDAQKKEVLFKIQSGYIEERLDFVENYQAGSINELSLAEIATPLFFLRDSQDPEIDSRIKDIVRARLTWREASITMAANSGVLGEGGKELIRSLDSLGSKQYNLGPDLFKMFFYNQKDRLEDGSIGITMSELGFRAYEAWDLLEQTNFDYWYMLSEAKKRGSPGLKTRITEWENKRRDKLIKQGKTDFNKIPYAFDAAKLLDRADGTSLEGQTFNLRNDTIINDERAMIMRDFLIEELKRKYKIDDYHARKSLQLAEEQQFLTMEAYLLDWDFLGGNEYGGLVNRDFWTKVDGSSGPKGKLTGAWIAGRIPTLTPGLMRSICYDAKNRKIASNAEPIYSDKIAEHLKNGDMSGKKVFDPYFRVLTCGKIVKAADLLKDSGVPDPKEVLNEAYFKKALDYFNKVDFELGSRGVVKTYWVASLMERMLGNAESPWNSNQLEIFKDLVLNRVYVGEDTPGVGYPFLTKEQWDWIGRNVVSYNQAIALLKTGETVVAMARAQGK